jgi:hypothetical protein
MKVSLIGALAMAAAFVANLSAAEPPRCDRQLVMQIDSAYISVEPDGVTINAFGVAESAGADADSDEGKACVRRGGARDLHPHQDEHDERRDRAAAVAGGLRGLCPPALSNYAFEEICLEVHIVLG